MTIAQKAQQCEDEIFDFHLQDGLLINQKVDPTGKVRYTNENAGSYTAVVMSSMCHKWRVTADPQARARAHQLAASVLWLETATGVPGMTTRQYKFMPGPGHDEAGWLEDKWHQCAFYRWQDNLSTDEMTYYLYGLGDYVSLCAEGEYRRRASASIRRVLGRMLDHGMRIVYADGTVTTWGDCSRATPKEPLFCLHALGYLKRGELFGLEERFANAYDEYIRDEESFRLAVDCYKLGLERNCWAAAFDWELASPEFELLIKYDKDPRRRAILKEGLLQMAAAPDTTVHSHLCTAVLGLGGEDKLRQWMHDWDFEKSDTIYKDWFLWVYWRSRSAGLLAEGD
jgi:hypothetical protein